WSDTTQNDLTFSYEAPPLLANYSQEPWEQFEPADWRTTPMGLFERNNNASALPSSPGNVINATYSNTVFGTLNSGGANNIDPFVDAGYNNYAPQSQPMLNTSAAPTTLTGDTSFTITHILQHGNGIPADDFNNWNDTLRYTQVFDNAYAYDDGSAEYAYYINRQNSGSVPSYLAYQFTLNKPDSIFGLSIYFDYVFVTNTTYTFKITLWSDKGGMPGDTLYQDTVTNPIYSHLGNDEFSTFYFKYPKILPAGPFYVGWEQTAGDSMNIGFDYNSGDHSSKLYYTTTYISPSNAGWQQSSFPGTLMLRPLMGNASKYVGINSIEAPKTDIVLYPNPAQNSVTLGGDISNAAVRIVGADGRVLYEDDNFSGNTVNTSFLPNGFYIVQITPKGKETVFKKLLISK
ncbi:MAG TPA: T9SS type A sorting domain-containing protein, partial [Bacteroidia bacterium]|nr:T9SS type A sorting domain-containing protein [Bacteroidia bacterium]